MNMQHGLPREKMNKQKSREFSNHHRKKRTPSSASRIIRVRLNFRRLSGQYNQNMSSVKKPIIPSVKVPNKQINSTISFVSSSSKVTPIDNRSFESIKSTTEYHSKSLISKNQLQNDFKTSQFSFGDRRELFTIGKQTNNETKRNKRYFSRRCFWCLILSFILLLLFLIALAIIIYLIFTLKSTSITANENTTFTIPTSQNSTTTSTSISLNSCTSSITNIEVIDKCHSCPTFNAYSSFIYNYTAIANTTRIGFGFRRGTRYFALDSVSIEDYAALGTDILTNGDFEKGDLTGWYYCDPLNGTSTNGVKSNFSYNSFSYFAYSPLYYYVGGNMMSLDYIIQTFPTEIGHRYRATMWAMHPGTGNLTSAELFIGV